MKIIRALALVLFWAASAPAITIDTVAVGNPGNSVDSTGFDAVRYDFRIGTTEVTSGQYAAFLNAKAASDPLGLFNVNMGFGGITRSGSSPHFSYSVITGRQNQPVICVSWANAIRFTNWLNNGQGNGDTETGAYTIATIITNNAPRNPGATWFLPSENEWYKAAYHKNDGVTGDYFKYPTSSDSLPANVSPPGDSNSANYKNPFGSVVDVASYSQTMSAYGAFDMAGNVKEWTEGLRLGGYRVYRGGSYSGGEGDLPSFWWLVYNNDGEAPTSFSVDLGFRVATIVPEPSAPLLALVATWAYCFLRKRR